MQLKRQPAKFAVVARPCLMKYCSCLLQLMERIMESKYPCPCLNCDRESCKENGSQFRECRKWLTWFRWWWKRFRGALKVVPQEQSTNTEKFYYSHPDHVKRYLQFGPCAGCSAEQNCDTPCKAYLRWYNARMEITRKRVGL